MHRLVALALPLVCALTLPSLRASAQQGASTSAPAAPTTASATTAAPAASAAPSATPAAAPAVPATTAAPAPRLVLPVVVIGIPDRSVAPAALTAIRDAVVATLSPAAGGRPVVALPDEARIAVIAACRDAACFGTRLNELQAMAGVLVRATRRSRTGPIDVKIEVLDPVSGAARLATPLALSVPAAAETSPGAALGAGLAQLIPALPSPPPPPPSLLVVTNVEGAVITVDGQEIGRAPVAAVEVTPGRHNVVVAAPGWASGNRMVQVNETGTTRADFDLEPGSETRAALESGRNWSSGAVGGGAMPGESGGDETPLYARWYVIGGAAAVVVATVMIIAVAASSGDPEIGPPAGIPVPPIQPR